MESIITIDLKNNPDILEDFEGLTAGDKVKLTAECTISELSENRAALPLDNLISVSSIGEESDADEEEEEDEEGMS